MVGSIYSPVDGKCIEAEGGREGAGKLEVSIMEAEEGLKVAKEKLPKKAASVHS